MKMKTCELAGAALDYAVSCCNPELVTRLGGDPHPYIRDDNGGYVRFEPSTNWAHGGPIIERERITTHAGKQNWLAWITQEDGDHYLQFGKTALIAAMRCYVASTLGETVEIPEELAK